MAAWQGGKLISLGNRRNGHSLNICMYFFINRDVPDELPVWVGANEARKSCLISQVGDNVFAAVK